MLQENPQKKLYIILIMTLAGIGGLLYGYDIGIIAGALLFIRHDIALTTTQISLLIAAVLGGGSIATLISGPLADKFGRRTMLTTSALLFMTGIIILVSSHNFLGLLSGRLIEGIGVGIITIIVPLYLAEAAPAAIRGSGVTAFQLFLTGGILLAYLVALLFAHSGNWRMMFLLSLIPAFVLLAGSFIITESPRFLFLKGKKEQTLRALHKSRNQQEVEHDLYLMNLLVIEKEKSQTKTNIWQKRYIWPFIIAFAVAILTQLTGINVFLQLCTLILKHAGLKANVVSMLGSVGIGLVNFIMTLIAMILIDKVGRKLLLILGTAGIVVALSYLAVIGYILPVSLLQGYLTIAGLVLFIASFAIGPGVVVWIILSELLPTSIRSKGMAICLFANSLASAILASLFLSLTNIIGYSGVFLLCGFFALLYLLVAIYLLPETKNKSLEEIEYYFQNKFMPDEEKLGKNNG